MKIQGLCPTATLFFKTSCYKNLYFYNNKWPHYNNKLSCHNVKSFMTVGFLRHDDKTFITMKLSRYNN